MARRTPTARTYHLYWIMPDGSEVSTNTTDELEAARMLRDKTGQLQRKVSASLTRDEIEALEGRAEAPVFGFGGG